MMLTALMPKLYGKRRITLMLGGSSLIAASPSSALPVGPRWRWRPRGLLVQRRPIPPEAIFRRNHSRSDDQS
jgi:hypothetical protein